MRYLYTLGFYFLMPLILLRLLLRSKKLPAYRQRVKERFGFYQDQGFKHCIWLHAVSYGEVVAAEPLIFEIKKQFPKLPIVITTMTVTGAQRVQQTFLQSVQHYFIPYDLPFAVKKFLNHIRPMIGIIMETELWPNLLHYAGRNSLRILLANARLSLRSQKGYLKIVKFTSNMVNQLHTLAAQTEQDACHFEQLGLPKTKIQVCGNLKFDIKIPQQMIAAGKSIRKEWERYSHVLIAASTHSNEEMLILQAFSKIQLIHPNTLLLLVPRHPERFDQVFSLCKAQNFKVAKRSAGLSFPHETQVLLCDSMGELFFFYGMSDFAFVGGSLVPIGGHNLLEPAAVALPIITGPFLTNFTAISQLLLEKNGLTIIKDAQELPAVILKLIDSPQLRRQQGESAYNVVIQNRGAVERHIAWVKENLPYSH